MASTHDLAARTTMLGAFTAGNGYATDADYSPRAWLIHKTAVTRSVAVSYTAWVRWAGRHPAVFAAMAAGQISESCARTLCTWTDRLPAGQAAGMGMGLRDLAVPAAEILARCRPEQPGEDPGRDFGDRPVTVKTTFQEAGVLHGDLAPQCAAVVQAVLDALAAPADAEDGRSREQRYHDALQEAMR